jgi:hypothetical protein
VGQGAGFDYYALLNPLLACCPLIRDRYRVVLSIRSSRSAGAPMLDIATPIRFLAAVTSEPHSTGTSRM